MFSVLDNFLVLLTTTVCCQNIKQTNCKQSRRKCYGLQLSQEVNTKSKNCLKRRNQNRHLIPMFIGTPCI